MASWKIGYPAGLSTVADEDAGKELYAPWGVDAISLSSNVPKSLTDGISAVGSSSITIDTPQSGTTFVGGLLRILDGACAGYEYLITAESGGDIFTVSGNPLSDGVLSSDSVELVSGESCYTWPEIRNPTRHDFKFILKNDAQRYPYATAGYCIPIGREPDSMSVAATFDSLAEFHTLMVLLSNPLDFAGQSIQYTRGLAAPFVLERGASTPNRQHLVRFDDFEVVRQASKGRALEVNFMFEQIDIPLFRGI